MQNVLKLVLIIIVSDSYSAYYYFETLLCSMWDSVTEPSWDILSLLMSLGTRILGMEEGDSEVTQNTLRNNPAVLN